MKFDLNDIKLDAVKDFFKSIWQDLRNKNLLPVAGVLLAALIIVPIVVARAGGGSDSPTPSSDVVVQADKGEVAAEAAAKAAPVEASDNRPDGQDVGGDPTNPFNQPKSKASTATTTPATPSGGSGAQGGGNTGGGSDSGSGNSGSGKSSGPNTSFEIDVKFGLAGQTKSKKNVAALSPFPSADDAYFVYLGATDGGKTAVFLVSTDVKATGDGVCSPSETNCKQVELRVGDTELFDVSDASNGAALGSYELELVKIHK